MIVLDDPVVLLSRLRIVQFCYSVVILSYLCRWLCVICLQTYVIALQLSQSNVQLYKLSEFEK